MTAGALDRRASAAAVADPLLTVDGLCVEFAGPDGTVRVVDDVGFSIQRGETLGLVGESGSGKTVSSLAVMRLIPEANGRIAAGSIEFDGRDLLQLDAEAMRRVRGAGMAMIFQEPMSSLNPAFTVGQQIVDAVRSHRRVSKLDARARAVEMLDRVGIPEARRRVDQYPHEFSGGMRQRAMIAMALACDPKLLIADEPTTALDVTVQAQILDLMRTLQAELGTAILFVTHDLGVVADICDHVAVMYAGQIVERARADRLFARPRHPYAEGLLVSMPQAARPVERLTVIPGQVPTPGALPAGCRFAPRCAHALDGCTTAPVELRALTDDTDAQVRCVRVDELALSGAATVLAAASARAEPRGSDAGAPTAVAAVPPTMTMTPPPPPPLLDVRGLVKHFAIGAGLFRGASARVRAVDGVDLTIAPAETLGLVGESGSGKSTIARLVVGLETPTAGTIIIDGVARRDLQGRAGRSARQHLQMVFQDPYSSLDPRASIAASVGEPLEIHRGLRGRARDERVARLLDLVGLGPHLLRRKPYEFSGGQRQRIAVARALALDPKLLVCDEPVSSLDVSTQSQVINLLADLQDRLGVAYLFIAHDLSVVRHISHRIAVMYLGRIVETGPAYEVAHRPRHPYTEALVSAIPVPDPVVQRARTRIVLEGDVPSPAEPPSGCRFHTRCPYSMDVCAHDDPAPFTTSAGTVVACHLHTHGPELRGAPLAELGRSSAGRSAG